MIVATWFFAEDANNESHYPQMRGGSSTPDFQEIYWNCVALFFATLARTNPDCRRLLFTNTSARSTNDATNRLLSELNVEINVLEFSYEPPPNYYHSWRNQFFLFDILEYLADHADEGEISLVLDSDCVFVNPLTAVEHTVAAHGVAPYAIAFPPTFVANGLSRYDLQELYGTFGHPSGALPTYCGGEIVAATTAGLRHIIRELRSLYPRMISRFRDGSPTFNTESHALSYVYHVIGSPIGVANPFIRRIWTGLPFRYADDSPGDLGLDIWHLPSEKRRGIKRLAAQACDPDSSFWTVSQGDEWRGYLARELGVGGRTVTKTVIDFAEELKSRLLK